MTSRRLRIAYHSPLPPARTGIADYSAELLPHLAEYVDLVLFVDDPAVVDATLVTQFPLAATADFPRQRSQFDLALYHMGNSRFHASIYELLLRYPGVVVLHDYFLHHFIVDITLVQGNSAGYGRELGYALGVEGVRLAEAVRRGQAAPPVDVLPLSARLLDVSLGVIVHSQFVADQIAARGRQAQVVPALITPFAGRSRRAELDLAPDALLFGVFGQLTPTKQLNVLLAAFAELRRDLPGAHLLLVGEPLDLDLDALLAEFGLRKWVHAVGFAPDLQQFVDWIHTADVVVNLRYPTMGETSATALRGMAAARPLIVNNVGWYAEIPDAAALKVPPNDPAALLGALRRLASDAGLRAALGAAARAYTDTHCAPARVANQVAAALHAALPTL